MKLSKIMLPFMMVGMLSQTGCIVGALTGNVPLAVIGAAVAVGSPLAVIVTTPDPCNDPCQIATGFMLAASLVPATAGVILNANDPGRQVALNPIPLSKENAGVLGVSVEDLENYNDVDLGQILETNRVIETTIADISEKKISTDEALNKLAPELGMKDSKDLMNVLKGDKLSPSHLSAFAEARGVSEASAQIYLQTRWSVKVK